MSETDVVRVCFVCAGNICRSPTAEAIMKRLVADAGWAERIDVESAGTYASGGASPDRRSADTAAARGLALEGRSEPVSRQHFVEFDYLVAMDGQNLRDLTSLAPVGHRARVVLMLDFHTDAGAGMSIPDPYYGEDGFDRVFELCENACRGLLEHLTR